MTALYSRIATSVLALGLGAAGCFAGPFLVTDPSSSWTAVALSSGNQLDYFNDQQTGQRTGDIVGTTANPGLYYTFYDGGTSLNHTDGELGFRVRLAEGDPVHGFPSALFIGVSASYNPASTNNKLDLFAGVDMRGSSNMVGIWPAGTGLNISPNTTSIASSPSATYALPNSAIYNYSQVTLIDGPLAASDIDGGGSPDYFLTFKIPFNALVTAAAALSPSLTITDFTPLHFIVVTATQGNTFNQDLGGIPKNYDPSATWDVLGGFSKGYTTAGGLIVTGTEVPEPMTLGLAAIGLLALGWFGRRRRG